MGKVYVKDEVGNTYGTLRVIARGGSVGKLASWRCLCSCGNEKVVKGNALRTGNTTSCGCMRRLRATINGRRNVKHGHLCNHTKSPEYALWDGAKRRCRKNGVEFTIRLEDIHIPEFCPVLGIRLKVGRGKQNAGSPSLDRFDTMKGYTPDNTWVISFRANSWKSNFSLTELRRMITISEERASR